MPRRAGAGMNAAGTTREEAAAGVGVGAGRGVVAVVRRAMMIGGGRAASADLEEGEGGVEEEISVVSTRGATVEAARGVGEATVGAAPLVVGDLQP